MLYHIFFKPEKFSVYWRRFLDEVVQLGVKSLFIVSLMSAFMGAVLVIQTATAIESAWIPDYTVGFTIKQSMLLEFCPTIISLILAGKVGSNNPTIHFVKTDFPEPLFPIIKLVFPFSKTKEISFKISTPEKDLDIFLT